MKAFLARLYADLRAIASVEYAIIAAVLAVAIIASFTLVSGKLLGLFTAAPI